LPVSRFDPVLVESFASLVAPGLIEGPFGFRSAVRKPIGSGLLVGLTPLGLLACGTEIDDVAHAKSAIPKSTSFLSA